MFLYHPIEVFILSVVLRSSDIASIRFATVYNNNSFCVDFTGKYALINPVLIQLSCIDSALAAAHTLGSLVHLGLVQ